MSSACDILIVDDKPSNLALLSAMLSEQGYEVRAAITGPMALMAVQAKPPDLILLDFNMPDMNGLDVCRQLKGEPHSHDIPIIFISALGELIDKLAAFQAGAVDYITKPFQLAEVMMRVETQLTVVRQRKELVRQQAELGRRYQDIERLQRLSERSLDRLINEPGRTPTARPARAPTRAPLTVLIAEIDHLVSCAEHGDPSQIAADLGHFWAMQRDLLLRSHAEVDGRLHLGGRVLAAFAQARPALHTARLLLRKSADFNERQSLVGRARFELRIALGHGPVLSAALSPADGGMTLIGEPVVRAAQLLAHVPLGHVALDSETCAALQGGRLPVWQTITPPHVPAPAAPASYFQIDRLELETWGQKEAVADSDEHPALPTSDVRR